MEESPAPVTGAEVVLQGVEDGPWAVEWWDTLAGVSLRAEEAVAAGGELRLRAPAFRADVAARARRR
jgi:hypothetical protein